MNMRADRDVLYFEEIKKVEQFEQALTMINLQKEAPRHRKQNCERNRKLNHKLSHELNHKLIHTFNLRRSQELDRESDQGAGDKAGYEPDHNRGCPCLLFQKGSLTVEASFCATAFFLALFSLLYLFQMILDINQVQMCLVSAARQYECLGTKLGTVEGALKKSVFIQWDEEKEICFARKRQQIPFLGGKFFRVIWYQQMQISAYRGRSMISENGDTEEYVYIAESGRVYHKNKGCVYLNPGIRSMKYRRALEQRNSSGGKYKQCRRCSHGVQFADGMVVYLTSYGSSYHIDRNCSGLKRTVQKIKLSGAGNMPACSKCG